MKEDFTKRAQKSFEPPFYHDAVAKLFDEHKFHQSYWSNDDLRSFVEPLSWNAYATFRCSEVIEYSGIDTISHAEFRQMFDEGRILFVKDAEREQNIGFLPLLQKGHEKISMAKHIHHNMPHDNLLSFATLKRLDAADYAYALYACLPTDGPLPPKTFTYGDASDSRIKTGYLPLELEFVDHYAIEREKAEQDIAETAAQKLRPTWRVPNFPPKPGDNF